MSLTAYLLGVLVCCLAQAGQTAACDASVYDVVWDSLAAESSDTYYNTMPLGNGALGSNVWFNELDGHITFIVSRTDAWNEADELIKVAHVRVEFSPNPFHGQNVSVRMDVANGAVHFATGDQALAGFAYIHSDLDVGVLNLTTMAPGLTATLHVKPIRTQPSGIIPAFDCLNYSVSADVQLSDTVVYHRNDPSVHYIKHVLQQENLHPLIFTTKDVLAHRTIGVIAWTASSTTTTSSSSSSAAPNIFLFTASSLQTGTVEEWLDRTSALGEVGSTPSWAAHQAWWQQFWAKSYICFPNGSAELQRLGQQYALNRMLVSMQGRTPYPVKFNGMIYTANRPPRQDYRDWGGRNWWQNLRLPYYSLFGSGDTDIVVASLLEAFYNTLPLAQARNMVYYNFSGVWWPEYTSLIGTTHPESYGCNRGGTTYPPIWYDADQWNHYNLQGSLDLCTFILDHYLYTWDKDALLRYLPILTGVVDFYRGRFPQGRIYPSQALETWQCPGYPPDETNCVANDLPTLAGLYSVIKRLLASGFLTKDQTSLYTAFLQLLPPLPTALNAKGEPMLAPCEICPNHTSNVENAELYAVHPYRVMTYGKPDLELATRAWAVRLFPDDEGWNQCAMDAALMGLTDEAADLVVKRAQTAPADGYRFQAFMPHLQDYEPSSDHLGVMNAALMYMLIQPRDDDPSGAGMWLLPAWPCKWDVEFKVYGPALTVIEGTVKGGKLQYTASSPIAVPKVTVVNCA